MMMIRGSDLGPMLRDQVLRAFIHRYTKDHVPAWVSRPDSSHCKPQFASDHDWLEHTFFWITKTGKLSEKHKYCESHPTWPEGI